MSRPIAIEKWEQQSHVYEVERSVPFGGGEEPETDVIFSVTISAGNVTDVSHSYGWQLDNYLNLFRDEIEGEALERYAEDYAEHLELYCEHMERMRKGDG